MNREPFSVHRVTKNELIGGKTSGEVISTPKPNSSILLAKLQNNVESNKKMEKK